MREPELVPLNTEQCNELIEAAQTMTDIARKAASTIRKVDDPLQIETTIISMCVATLIAQEGSHGIDSKRKPAGIEGRLIEARVLGAGAGIGQIIGQLPERFVVLLIEAASSGIGQAITKASRFE